MTHATDVLAWVASRGPGLGAQEGVRFGEPAVPVTGISIAWMATPGAIEGAAAAGANLLIVHEALFYPSDVLLDGGPADWLTWPPNRRRLALLAQHQITVVRAHRTIDRRYTADAFAAQLGLPDPAVIEEPYLRVYDLPPTPLAALIDQVKERTGLAWLRVTPATAPHVVRRVGLLFGGLALAVNVEHQARLARHGCDAFIAGESDTHGLRFAAEAGIVLIETSHEASEQRGLDEFAIDLQAAFPDLPVHIHEEPMAYTWA
jgi:putative NIF3 family GTP cyclohydrolase 1 type 2